MKRQAQTALAMLGLGVTMAAMVLMTSAGAAAQETFRVEGRVVNGSPGGRLPVGQAVTLHLFTPEQGLETLEATTDSEARFSFSLVHRLTSGRYLLSTRYDGIDYTVEITQEEAEGTVEMEVFDSTEELTALTFDSHIWMLRDADGEEGMLSALEIALVTNQQGEAFRPVLDQPGSMSFLRFSLPAGATGLDVQSDLRGGEIIDVGTGFGLTAPVPPGSHQLAFSYVFPYQGSEVSVSKGFLQGASVFRLLWPEGVAEAHGPTLNKMDSTAIGDVTYQVWEARDMGVGVRLEITLSSLPQPSVWYQVSTSLTKGKGLKVGVPAALGLGLVTLLAYALVVRRDDLAPQEAAQGTSEPGESAELDSDREDS